MIKKILMTSVAFSLVLLIGCSQKKPKVNDQYAGKNNVSDATQIVGKTVSIDENAYGNGSTSNSGSNGSNNGQYNSSSSGFQSIYFDFGGYGISSDMENGIATNREVLSKTNTRVKIEGNCDEFGTDEYNYALGLKRAKAVKDTLVAQGIPAQKMVIISFGESNPVCSNPTDECYAQNRRVDLHLAQ